MLEIVKLRIHKSKNFNRIIFKYCKYEMLQIRIAIDFKTNTINCIDNITETFKIKFSQTGNKDDKENGISFVLD